MKAEKKKPKRRMFNMQPKRLKRSIHVKGSWKAIELDPSVFSEEGLEGLVCFEELTDYRLVEPEKAANPTQEVKKGKKKKGKKRKASEEEEEVVVEGEESESKQEVPGPSKKKRNKKNPKKSAQPEEAHVDVPHADTCATEEAVEDKAAEKKTSSDPNAQSKSAEKKNNKKKKLQKENGSSPEEQSKKETPSQAEGAKPKKSVEDKVAKKPKKQVKSWTNAALSGSDDKDADVSAWKDLFVPSLVLKALSSLGFSSPTAIQALTLPSAIRDRKDILGAAETGEDMICKTINLKCVSMNDTHGLLSLKEVERLWLLVSR